MYIPLNSKGLTLAYYTRVTVFLDSACHLIFKNEHDASRIVFVLSSGGIIDSVWFDREEYSVSQQGVQ
jgi:hypothetical protein